MNSCALINVSLFRIIMIGSIGIYAGNVWQIWKSNVFWRDHREGGKIEKRKNRREEVKGGRMRRRRERWERARTVGGYLKSMTSIQIEKLSLVSSRSNRIQVDHFGKSKQTASKSKKKKKKQIHEIGTMFVFTSIEFQTILLNKIYNLNITNDIKWQRIRVFWQLTRRRW